MDEQQLIRWDKKPMRATGFSEAFLYSFFSALAVTVGAAAMIGAVVYKQWLFLAFTFGAIGFVLMLVNRKEEYDRRAYHEVAEYAPVASIPFATQEKGQDPLIQPWWTTRTGANSGSITRGDWKYTGKHWKVIADQFITAGRCTRVVFERCNELLPDSKPFPNITKRYNEYRAEMVKAGWVDAETDYLTDLGKNELGQFLLPQDPPQPPYSNGVVHVVGPTPPTTTDDDRDQGAL